MGKGRDSEHKYLSYLSAPCDTALQAAGTAWTSSGLKDHHVTIPDPLTHLAMELRHSVTLLKVEANSEPHTLILAVVPTSPA